MPRTKKQSNTRLPGGPASIWISRKTHEQLRQAASRRGQKLQWLADKLIADAIAKGEVPCN